MNFKNILRDRHMFIKYVELFILARSFRLLRSLTILYSLLFFFLSLSPSQNYPLSTIYFSILFLFIRQTTGMFFICPRRTFIQVRIFVESKQIRHKTSVRHSQEFLSSFSKINIKMVLVVILMHFFKKTECIEKNTLTTHALCNVF